MDIQKQQPKMATKEQIRLAELTQTGRDNAYSNDDISLQKRLKKVIELTNCTTSEAEVALMDCEGNVEDAIALLLDNPDVLVLWSQQGKTRKSKSASFGANISSKSGSSQQQARRGESQNHRVVGRFRNRDGDQQGQGGSVKQFSAHRNNRGLQKEQEGSATNFKRNEQFGGGKTQNRNMGARRERVARPHVGEKEAGGTGTNATEGDWSVNGWSNGDEGTTTTGWGESAGWTGEKKKGEEFSAENSYAKTAAPNAVDKDDEWKNGPRVFMPTSGYTNAPSANNTSSWPTLDNSQTQTNTEYSQILQPKTFAAVAASKKMPPKLKPSQEETTILSNKSFQNQEIQSFSKAIDEPTAEWSSSLNWGTSVTAETVQDEEPADSTNEIENVVPTESFGASAHSLNVNHEYTDHLKSAIGLVQTNQNRPTSPTRISSAVSGFMQQQIQSLQQQPINDSLADFENPQKVEFATPDVRPPATTTTNYQFGFCFNVSEANTSSMINESWSHPHHISTIELDRSVLKNSTGNVLGTMANIPTTSSTISAHFSTSAHQHAQSVDNHRNATPRGAGLSFSDPASVNYPPSNGPNGGLSTLTSGNPSTLQQYHQSGKPLYTASNQSVVTGPQHLQHLQQQPQTLYHQASAAGAATGVPHQFPGYNLPYMYSPVAAAPAITGGSADIDRFFMQPQPYGGPYSGLDMQLGAMSLGPPTTLPSHRGPIDSFMENKFGPPPQQSVNQTSSTATGNFQHNQVAQHHQRGTGQSETAPNMLGGNHVAPPPGFGMPSAPSQPSYMQPANIHSLFQMPTYPLSYHQPYMMQNTGNRLQTSQRTAQTSPPDGNGQQQQRRHDGRGNDNQNQGYVANDNSGDHSTGMGPQSYNVGYNTKYRSYNM